MKRNQKTARSTSTPTLAAPAISPETASPAKPEGSALSKFTDAAIILTFITFFGYWGAFSYESAFFDFFNIPYYLISLTPVVVFFTSAGWIVIAPLIIFVVVGIVVVITLKPVGKKIERKFPKIAARGSLGLAILLLAYMVFTLITDQEFRKSLTVQQLFSGALIIGFWISFVFLYERYKENRDETQGIFIALLVSGFFLVSYLDFLILRTIGEKMAQDQKVFYVYQVPPSSPSEVPATPTPPSTEVAVIRTSGDYLLTVPFTRDPKWAVFHNKLIIVKMSDSKTPISLSLEKIGPLHKPGTTPPQP